MLVSPSRSVSAPLRFCRTNMSSSRTGAAGRKSDGAVPWPTGPEGWRTALTVFAKTENPRASLPPDVYLRHDAHTLAIYDGYPKAHFHFLVLPRVPFPLPKAETSEPDYGREEAETSPAKPQLSLAGGKLSLGATKQGSSVPASHLKSLSDLLASPYATQVLERLRIQGQDVADLVRQEMRHVNVPPASGRPCEIEWGVRLGFHAVPSMETVHLHVISDDLVSDRLKNKKHYQSFRPDQGFWLDLDYVEHLVRKGEKQLPHSPAHYESLLKSPLISFYDGKEYRNIPQLKEHLKSTWQDSVVAAASAKASTISSRKRTSDTGPPNAGLQAKTARISSHEDV